jgi:hypothetical protein
MGDRATSGMSDEYDAAVGRLDGIDRCNDRVDVVAQGDLGTLCGLRLHAGQGECMGTMARLPQLGNDLVPGRAVEPQTGN